MEPRGVICRSSSQIMWPLTQPLTVTPTPQTRWGSSTLTVAFKLLLKEALTEPSNQRFVLMDESTVPLYPAAAIYLQLMSETKSRVASCVVRRQRLEPSRGHDPEPGPVLDRNF